jgi:hypothetical protein
VAQAGGASLDAKFIRNPLRDSVRSPFRPADKNPGKANAGGKVPSSIKRDRHAEQPKAICVRLAIR